MQQINFKARTSRNEYKPIEKLSLQLIHSTKFLTHVKFDLRVPQYEIGRVGFCQLSLACFKYIYSLLKNGLSLTDLTREPEIITYDDSS